MEKGNDRRKAKALDGEDKLKRVNAVKYRINVAVDYRSYRLLDTSPKHDSTVSKSVAKMPNRMKAPMKPHAFDPLDPISISGFLKSYKLA